MKKTVMKSLAIALCLSMLTALAGCGKSDGAESSSPPASEQNNESKNNSAMESVNAGEAEKEQKEVVSLTLYPENANLLSGQVGGYKGDYLASRGFEIEVWAYSDDKTNAILASGDLPDIMYVTADQLNTMIEGDMILQLDDYLDQMPHVQENMDLLGTAFNYIREFRSNGTGKVWGMPVIVGSNTGKFADETDRYGVKLFWDYYEAIGAPKIENFDDLVDVCSQMLEAYEEDRKTNPEMAEAKQAYGMVLDNSLDTNCFGGMYLWYAFQGYSADYVWDYLLEWNMVTGEVSSILDDDSVYRKGVEWYNKMFRAGNLDPDSISTDRTTQSGKTRMVPAGTLPGWAPSCLPYYIPGTNIYYNTNMPYGGSYYIVVNAKTNHLDACIDFLDFLADPFAQFAMNYGPEGEIWYIDGNDIYLTEEFWNWYTENGYSTSGYTYANGEDYGIWNTQFIVGYDVPLPYTDGEGNQRESVLLRWKEMEAGYNSETKEAWKKTTGHNDWIEWIESENAYYTEGPLDYIRNFLSEPSDSMALTKAAIKDIVVPATWKMIYAESDEELNQLWDKMVEDCEGLNYKEMQDWRLQDIQNAIKIRDSLEAN